MEDKISTTLANCVMDYLLERFSPILSYILLNNISMTSFKLLLQIELTIFLSRFTPFLDSRINHTESNMPSMDWYQKLINFGGYRNY